MGALLVIWRVRIAENRWRDEALAIIGLGLIVVSILAFSAKTPFPGIAALLPCAGAAMIIGAGEIIVRLWLVL